MELTELEDLRDKRNAAQNRLAELLTCQECYHTGPGVTEQDYHDRVLGRDSTAYLCVDGDACEARKN